MSDDIYAISETDVQDALIHEAGQRRHQMLLTAFGPVIKSALWDDTVTEIMVNPDGRLWIEWSGEGRIDLVEKLSPKEVERIIRLVAACQKGEVHEQMPIISSELSDISEVDQGSFRETGAIRQLRFEGLLPPIVTAPCFVIRKPAKQIFELKDYVDAGIATPLQAKALSEAVIDRKNILVIGGTASGKTTLVNALLSETASTGDRIVILEDTRELQCAAEDVVCLRTKSGIVSLSDLVRSTLRLRPDRIMIGEVRGSEALDMLKAWNTGHPGGIATIHANSGHSGLYRLEQLIQEAVTTVPRRLISDAIDILVFIEGRDAARKIRTISSVNGLDTNGDYRLTPLVPVHLTTV